MKTAVFVIMFTASLLQSQTHVVSIRLDSTSGQHATVDSFWPTLNLTPDPDFSGAAWTQGGVPYTVRGLIKFNLNFVDSNSTVNSAYLSLYGNFEHLHSPGHSTLDGSNTCYLRKVLQPWDQYLVTWSNQPTMAILNQVLLPQSISQYQDYLDIDVTNLVRDMINHPSSNNGFIIGLITESYYRSLNFASSHSADSTRRPKLVITYTGPNGIQPVSNEVPNHYSLSQNYPNPFNPSTVIKFSIPPSKGVRGMNTRLTIYDALGREIEKIVDENLAAGSYKVDWNASNYPSGVYFYRLSAKDPSPGSGQSFTETKKMLMIK